uniref:Uncharacterized protein n=1 Tax=Trichobilharzia regenti TaxID=157069 RepID=A0AA85KCV3_TRIRE|nr:unnamed protein product [Trichobilharzia regenti]
MSNMKGAQHRVQKKPTLLSFGFKDYDISGRIEYSMTAVSQRASAAAIPFHATPNCMNRFACTCHSIHIGRTERRICDRIAEHLCLKDAKVFITAMLATY